MKSLAAILAALAGSAASVSLADVLPPDADYSSQNKEALEANPLLDKAQILGDVSPEPGALHAVWNNRIFSWTAPAQSLELASNVKAASAKPAETADGPRELSPPCASYEGWAPNQSVNGNDISVTIKRDGRATTFITDSRGQIALANLEPGSYEIDVDGKSLAAAIDAAASSFKQGRSGPSVSIGGFFGGGGRSTSDHKGAAPTSHSGGGGAGLGITIPMGHGDNPQPAENPITAITISLPSPPDLKGNSANGGSTISVETPYCRETEQGLRLKFTVPVGGTKNGFITISLEPPNTTLNEERIKGTNTGAAPR